MEITRGCCQALNVLVLHLELRQKPEVPAETNSRTNSVTNASRHDNEDEVQRDVYTLSHLRSTHICFYLPTEETLRTKNVQTD